VVSIGKLHFRGRPGDDHGFTEEIVPMHVIDGLGDVKGLVRDDIPMRKGGEKMAKYAGPGESTYTAYDRDIASRAQIWLHEEATRDDGKPWVLFVSFVAPHFPLIAPPEWFYRYARMDLPMPKQYAPDQRPRHPFVDEYARVVDYGTHFASEADVKRALAGYSGLVSAMDENLGKVLRALDDTGLTASTRVIYTSDHGDNAGARGLWGKSTLYEESSGVPMIAAGDEMGRTQHGNNNAYCLDDETSWLDWAVDEWGQVLLEFTRHLIAVRRQHPVFRPRSFFQGRPVHEPSGTTSGTKDIGWFDAGGEELDHTAWSEHRHTLGMFLDGAQIHGPGPQGEQVRGDSFLLLLHAAPAEVAFRLPGEPWASSYEVVLDTSDDRQPVPGLRVDAGHELALPGHSAALLRALRQCQARPGRES